jgi:hypothetical protein
MRLSKGICISSYLLFTSPFAHADSIALHIGQVRGDTVHDPHEYASSIQNEYFHDEKLEGTQLEASYVLQFRPMGRFTSSWIFGLGHVTAKVEESYPTGSLTLERNSSFLLGGFRLQDESLVESLIFGAELILIKGVAGRVTLRSPAGREEYDEVHNIDDIHSPTLAATVGYRASSSLLLNTKIRFDKGNVPNIFVGVSYDISHL